MIRSAYTAVSAYNAIRNEEDFLAEEVYRAAHAAHLRIYGRAHETSQGIRPSPWLWDKKLKVWYLPNCSLIGLEDH